MKLVHVSEEPDIRVFHPRIPYREDVDRSKGLVWALTEQHLPQWLTPRDCPRVTYRIVETTTQEDIERYFSSSARYCIAIEYGWFKTMAGTVLYVYEFDPANFYFDSRAGFYVSDKMETPIAKTRYGDLFGELFRRNVEVRLLNNLWDFADEVKNTTLQYSISRMANAQPRAANLE